MKRMKLLTMVVLMLALSLVLFAGGCGEKAAEKPVLKMGLIPAEDIEAMMTAFGPMQEYLEQAAGVQIELFKATDYTAVIEGMRAERVDLAFFGPFSYVLAAERANAMAIVGGGDADGNLGVYHSVLITHKDSGLTSIDDVKARAGELTLSFVDPASTSGHLIPRGFMESIDISVDEHFKEIIFAGGHDASVLAVKAQSVDLGATWEGPYQRAIDEGLITPEEVSVIWTSDGIPRSPVAVRADMDPVLIEKLRQAFLDMPEKAPAAMQQFESVWDDNTHYVAVDDSDYDFIRQVAIGLGKM
ncbi:MAG: phosphate/phosphite/phosphonate ABC transporter substrate-binding protein [Desulfotomaculum sp.]|nr:phosphate/phosphite/phosphonate ABC transporter substrate-binding protein [Desulfotomaculum sp.]